VKLRMFMWTIGLIAARGVVSEACELPPINPPPYHTLNRWSPGPRVVQVYIDDDFAVNSTITEQLLRGATNWNIWGLVDCSFVGFLPAGVQAFGPETYGDNFRAPADSVYIISVPNLNCPNGGCVLHTYDQGRTVGAKIMFDPAVWNNNSQAYLLSIGWYAWASSHEIGHTFALSHLLGAYPGANVMTGYVTGDQSNDPYADNTSLPTLCDIVVVAGLYCSCFQYDCPDDYIWSSVSCECVPYTGPLCTTYGWNGTCPPGTSPNGFGMCCGQGACELNGWFWNFTNSTCNEIPQFLFGALRTILRAGGR
jgi:hypothetical protein